MPVDITNQGNFIDATKAKANLSGYLNDHGKPQPMETDPDHVFGYVFGLAKIKELIAKIDQHNANPANAAYRIGGVRIYNSKTGPTKDLLIVPVTKDSQDYPATIHDATATNAGVAVRTAPSAGNPMILTAARPCPNQCSKPPQN